MAQRRMFSLSVIDTDRFLDLPASSQNLYFHLGMRADDDGFVGSPKKITAMVNCSADDMKLLIAKGYVIPFDSGVCVIRDWKVNNYIASDRYHATVFLEEKALLTQQENGSYTIVDTPRIQTGSDLDTQSRLAEDSLELGQIRERNSCGAPESAAPPAASLVLNDGSYFDVSEEQVERWKALYPAVDVRQELNNMTGWLEANPTQRKTRRGIMRFCNAWLAREQDKPARGEQRRQTPRGNHTDFLDLV